jgi:hypothetical protein
MPTHGVDTLQRNREQILYPFAHGAKTTVAKGGRTKLSSASWKDGYAKTSPPFPILLPP